MSVRNDSRCLKHALQKSRNGLGVSNPILASLLQEPVDKGFIRSVAAILSGRSYRKTSSINPIHLHINNPYVGFVENIPDVVEWQNTVCSWQIVS